MSFKENTKELRYRFIFSFIVFIISFVLCYILSEKIYLILVKPLCFANPSSVIIYTKLTDAFFTYIRVAFFGALCITVPFVLIQVYCFVAPGLYLSEKIAFIKYMALSVFFFVFGVIFAYKIIMPIAWEFLAGFGLNNNMLILMPKIDEYLSLVMDILFGFGMAFQMPMIILFLNKIQIIDCKWLRAKRRIAIILIFTLSAILTPPDVLSQILLAIPLIVLYELSIILCTNNAKCKNKLINNQ